jgi:PAS domain S-box-containing protein
LERVQVKQDCRRRPPKPKAPTPNVGSGSVREELAIHRAVLGAMLEPIITIDALGTIRSASDSTARVLGYAPAELRGRDISLLMPEPHRSRHKEYIDQYLETGRIGPGGVLGCTREVEAVCKDGQQIPIEVSVARVDVPGRAGPLFTAVVRDITERKRAEGRMHEQLRVADRLAVIGALAAGLGHDMNNVLLPIRCRLEALETALVSDRCRREFRAIGRSVAYLQQLSDGLRLLALDPRDAEASAPLTDLRRWWEQVGVLLRRAVPRSARLETSLPKGIPAVRVAPHRLTQAVLNLVVNAGEAIAPTGRIRVWAEALATPRWVRLVVSDNGCGMPEDVRRRAMDPFFTTKSRGLGTGLGLALVRGVVEGAGGSIQIASEPGCGTIVSMTLPASAARERPGARAPGCVVSLLSGSTAAFLTAFLRSGGFVVRRQRDSRDRGQLLWVVEPAGCSLDEVRQFLAADARRRVVCCGAGGEKWSGRGVIRVDRTDEFAGLRAGIEEAIREIMGSDNERQRDTRAVRR